MTHQELVQLATDLLFTSAHSEKWLSSYDLALSSETDQQLEEFVARLGQEINQPRRMAA